MCYIMYGSKCKCMKHCYRQKRGALPSEPTTLADFDVTEPWNTTGGPNSEPFLLFDSGRQDPERVIVFASQMQLQHLAVSDKWFMDGNYKMAPSLFKQVYVIRVPLGSSAVTCVYAFLTGIAMFAFNYTSMIRYSTDCGLLRYFLIN